MALANDDRFADKDPFILALKSGDFPTFCSILGEVNESDRKHYVNRIDRNGSTPIFHTVWNGTEPQYMCLKALLEAGADPNVQNNRLNTALHLACERGHIEFIRLLIDFGADIAIKNWEAKVCWQCAEAEKLDRIKFVCEATREAFRESQIEQLSSQMTPQQRSSLRVCFDEIDKDRDGLISFDELANALTLLGFEAPKTPDDARIFFCFMDKNSDNAITFPEFVRAATIVLMKREPEFAKHSKHHKSAAKEEKTPDKKSAKKPTSGSKKASPAGPSSAKKKK
eukprot:TRINITY_DN3665_c0_g5_i1.p1 TRINITY_DN3665_c0_g5~~TRINITY_DN3665_c0_g5_i1.p1  ORF type:complete len:283 (+),score=51.17 TRINITY_DN3665_c0_g5_i1:72-920(+)